MNHKYLVKSLGIVFCIFLILIFPSHLKRSQASDSSFTIENGVLKSYTGKSTSVTIPSKVTEIDSYALKGNQYLQTVIIPSSVKKIGESAFKSCKKLKKVTIKSGTTTVGAYAFQDCKSLTTLAVPKTVTKVGAKAFHNTAWLNNQKGNFVTIGNGVLIHYGGKSMNVTLPSKVKYIADETFTKTKITSIKFTNNVKALGNNVFTDCTKLNHVMLSNKLKTIKPYTFAGCKNLTEITIPASVTKINENAFMQCKKLNKVTIPSNSKLTTVGSQAFIDCITLKKISLPDSVKIIGFSAFERCGLTTFAIPEKVTTISESVFRDCSKLKSVSVSDLVESIQSEAFRGCSSLMDISLPSMIKEVGIAAFAETKITANSKDNFIIADDHVLLNYVGSEENVSIPDSISVIAENAFQGNLTLNELTLGENTTYINSRAFFDCEYLEKVQLNQCLESIGKAAFMDCSSLTSITFPSSLTELDNYAFFNCTSLCYVGFSTTKITYGIDTLSNTKWYDDFDGDFIITKTGTLLGYKGKDPIVTLPNTIAEFAPSSFEYTTMEQITIPGNITMIPLSLFYCSTVKNVIFSEGTKEIGERCFEECYDIETVTIPDSVTKIGSGMFTCEEHNSSKATIICSKGSYAEQYAKSHGIAIKYRSTR